MVTEITLKKNAMTVRGFVQIIALAGLLYFGYRFIYYNRHHVVTAHHANDCIAFLVLLVSNVFLFLNLRYTPSLVLIDYELEVLEIKYLMLPTKTLDRFNITGYSTTTIKRRSENSFGIIIHVSNGKKVLLSDEDFEDYTLVELFLADIKITNLGEEKYSAISYYSNQLSK
jgi:hypothetical protein